MSLYKRLTEAGTLSEPQGYPDARFSLPSTINWMRAMAMIVEHEKIQASRAAVLYAGVSARKMTVQQENTIFEQLLFALHQCSALRALKNSSCKADVARVGIVSWYYGIYASASAMVTAKDGSFQDDHTGTARIWDQQIAVPGLMSPPFDVRITSLVKKTADFELSGLSPDKRFPLVGGAPSSIDEAFSVCLGYLSGSVNWWRWRTEEDVKNSKDFRDLGFSNFRKKEAQELRDARLAKKSVSFLHQAFRYRGKANYRDAIFLGYGASVDTKLATYVDDLSAVLEAFTTLAGVFCSRRLGSKVWDSFLSDLTKKRAFTLSPEVLWNC